MKYEMVVLFVICLALGAICHRVGVPSHEVWTITAIGLALTVAVAQGWFA